MLDSYRKTVVPFAIGSLVLMACASKQALPPEVSDPQSVTYPDIALLAQPSQAEQHAAHHFTNGASVVAIPRALDKQVLLRFSESNQGASSIEAASGQSYERTYTTEFWPYAYEWVDQGRAAIVVGEDLDIPGSCLIQRWSFAASNGPTYRIQVGKSPRFEKQVHWQVPERLAVETLYRGTLPGHSPMRSLIENAAFPGGSRLFFQVYGSSELFELDTQTAEIQAIALPSDPAEAGISAPKPVDLQGLLHNELGLVYTLGFGDGVPGWQLVDSDRDGVLDRTLQAEGAALTLSGAESRNVLERF